MLGSTPRGDGTVPGLAYFAAAPGPWLMHGPALAAFRAGLAGSTFALRGGRPGEGGGDKMTGEPDLPGYRRQGRVGVVSIAGPIVRHDNEWNRLVADVFGGTILDRVLAGLERAAADKEVGAILLAVDSPGGEGNGLEDAAAFIRSLDATKPVHSHISGLGASAAYWLAAAAGRVTASPAAYAGSIGTRIEWFDDSEFLAKHGFRVHQFASTQSPRKVIDPASDEGRQQVQEYIDAHADQFIGDVARYRGTTPLRVMEDFGQGDVLIAGEAYKVGMVDAVQSHRAALDEASRAALRGRAAVGRVSDAVATARPATRFLTARGR